MTRGDREADAAVRYVCTVCMQTASTAPGPCPTCNVDRPPLDNPEGVDELRKRAVANEQRRQARGWGLLMAVGTVIALMLYIGLGLLGWLDIRPHESKAAIRIQLFNSWLIVIWLVVLVPLALIYKRRHPDRDDAQTATVPELLRRLGITVDR